MKSNVVAVNYNSAEESISMLESLRDCSAFLEQIILVDNNSHYVEFSKLLNWQKSDSRGLNVDIIRLDENRGYFGGLNLGIKALKRTDRAFTIICNNDVLYDKQFFLRLSRKKFAEDVFALCPSVRTLDGCYQNPALENKPTSFRYFFYKIYFSNYLIGTILLKAWRCLGLGADSRRKKDYVEKQIFIGIGAIFVLTPTFFHYNTHLPAPTFLYGEEAFLSRRIYSQGGRQIYCPDLEILHLESVSTNRIPGRLKYHLTQEAFQQYKDYYASGAP